MREARSGRRLWAPSVGYSEYWVAAVRGARGGRAGVCASSPQQPQPRASNRHPRKERDVESESSDPSGGDNVKVEQQDQQICLNYKRIWESSFTHTNGGAAGGRPCVLM